MVLKRTLMTVLLSVLLGSTAFGSRALYRQADWTYGPVRTFRDDETISVWEGEFDKSTTETIQKLVNELGTKRGTGRRARKSILRAYRSVLSGF